MFKATDHHSASRRGLLTTSTAALLTGAAIVTAARAAPVASLGDDADLIALCARRDADRLALVEEIAEIPATTRAGLYAKAQAMLGVLDVHTHSLDDLASLDAHARHRLAQSLARDVLAIVGRAAA